MSSDKEFTPDDVAQHNSEKDLWITIHGYAYDLTKFLKEHPGGEEVLLNLAGQDGTTCFDDVGHSQEAIQLRDSLRVGPVSGSSTSGAQTSVSSGSLPTVDDDDWQYEEPKEESSGLLPLFIALGIALYAIIFYYIF